MTAPPAGALEACLALLEKATPGEWHAMIRGDYGDGNEADVNGPDGNEVGGAEFTPPGYGDTIRGQMYETDARAIAAAVNLLRTYGPALLAALRLREGCQAGRLAIAPNKCTPAMFDAGFEANGKQYASDPLDDVVARTNATWSAMVKVAPTADDLARVLEEGE